MTDAETLAFVIATFYFALSVTACITVAAFVGLWWQGRRLS